MIGPRLKACLFVIGRWKQSSLPPPLSDTRRLTLTHFSPRPLSSPLWRCNQDGIKQPDRVLLHLDEMLFDTAASMRTDSQPKSQHATHISALLREWGQEWRPVS